MEADLRGGGRLIRHGGDFFAKLVVDTEDGDVPWRLRVSKVVRMASSESDKKEELLVGQSI